MEQYLHKVMLRKLDFGRDRKGLALCTKERRRLPPLIYHYCAIFCCFLIKCKYSHNLVDRISELPPDVLARIVSLLPLKEAVATSVLSRRWRYAWTFTVNLDFDPGKALFRLIDLKQKLLDQENRRYVHWVNSIVEQHAGSDIKKFRACFVLDHHFASSIDRWVQFSMRKRVEVLDLDFLKLSGDPAKGLYSFTSNVLGLEKTSSLNNYIGFKSLKVLHLVFVAVTGDVLEYFLSHCPVLERLSVTYACSLVNLRVVDPPSGLKYLELKHCYYLKTIEICGANLVSVSVEGRGRIEIIISNVPFLVEASLTCNQWINPNSMRQVFSQLSCCLYQLESLKLRVVDVECNDNYIFPTLANVKNLELTICADYKWSLSQLSSFMRACPSMQRLVLKMYFPEDEEGKKIKKAAKCPHHSLRVVEVEGYVGHANIDEHVMYLIDNAVELEKIIIDPVMRWAFHPTGADRKKKHFKREERARSHAMSLLKVKVPSSIEFVCL